MNTLLKKIKENNRLKEFFRYGIFGFATTVLNIVVYQALLPYCDYRVSNLIAIIASKVFAYVTNKLYVFRSRCTSRKELILEIGRFIISRGATGLVDYFGLIIAIDVLGLNRVWSKYAVQIVVIILNYLLGKRVVFLNAKSSSSKKQDQRRDIC